MLPSRFDKEVDNKKLLDNDTALPIQMAGHDLFFYESGSILNKVVLCHCHVVALWTLEMKVIVIYSTLQCCLLLCLMGANWLTPTIRKFKCSNVPFGYSDTIGTPTGDTVRQCVRQYRWEQLKHEPLIGLEHGLRA